MSNLVIQITDKEHNITKTCSIAMFISIYEKLKKQNKAYDAIRDLEKELQHIEEYICLPDIGNATKLGIYLLKSINKLENIDTDLNSEFINWGSVWEYGNEFAKKYNGEFAGGNFLIKNTDFGKGINDEVKKALVKTGELK